MPAEYEVLEPGGHQAFADAVKSYADRAGGTGTTQLANGSVTTAKLADEVKAGLNTPDEFPALVAGSSRAMLGDAETASWMERTTAADGAALIESVQGNTLVWNQLTGTGVVHNDNANVSMAFNTTTGKLTIVVAQTPSSNDDGNFFLSSQLTLGHKYLFKPWNRDDTSGPQYYLVSQTGSSQSVPSTAIFTANEYNSGVGVRWRIRCTPNCPTGTYECHPQLFDLTVMFGAGNEPSTVAEFESLFPKPYYPYDAGSLLPVRMEGIETVGFNQWDEVAEDGYISDTTGENVGSNIAYLRSKGYIPVFPGMAYHFTCTTGNNVGKVYYYDADKAFLSFDGVNCNSTDKTPPASARYMRFWLNYPGSYQGDLCINLSDTARNGTYEPYWSSHRTIPAATYFPDGLRSAGSVYDELRADAAVTRVWAVDLGTMTWSKNATNQFYALLPESATSVTTGALNVICTKYIARNVYDGDLSQNGICTTVTSVWVVDTSYTDAATFKAAMDGVMLHYALATPTTTPIDPPLPLSYRVGAGGTERVMVASGTTSAPPIFATRYPLDPADLAASIAPVDGPIAKTNHQVGDLIMLGFTLCKATQVIVTGETIAIGTNVTRTSVAAELAALSQ